MTRRGPEGEGHFKKSEWEAEGDERHKVKRRRANRERGRERNRTGEVRSGLVREYLLREPGETEKARETNTERKRQTETAEFKTREKERE